MGRASKKEFFRSIKCYDKKTYRGRERCGVMNKKMGKRST